MGNNSPGALFEAIMTKIANSALWNDVGGRVFIDEAPPGTLTFPYVVFFLVTDAQADTFSAKGDNITIQFSIFSSSSSATEIFTIYNDLRSILDDASLAVTGSTLVWCYWLHLATMTTDIANPDGTSNSVKHWAVDYSIKAEAA